MCVCLCACVCVYVHKPERENTWLWKIIFSTSIPSSDILLSQCCFYSTEAVRWSCVAEVWSQCQRTGTQHLVIRISHSKSLKTSYWFLCILKGYATILVVTCSSEYLEDVLAHLFSWSSSWATEKVRDYIFQNCLLWP